MSFQEISEELGLSSVYEENQEIFKIISYYLEVQRKDMQKKYKKQIKDLRKDIDNLKRHVEDNVSNKLNKKSSAIKEKLNANIRDKIMVNRYQDCILIHGNTWDAKPFIKNYPFVWNPRFKGWVKKLPFDDFRELVDSILDVFPKIIIQENDCKNEMLFKDDNQDVGEMFSRKPRKQSTGWMDKYAKTGIEPNSDDEDNETGKLLKKNKIIKKVKKLKTKTKKKSTKVPEFEKTNYLFESSDED